MTVPYQRSGNNTLDQVQQRTQSELRRLTAQVGKPDVPQLRVVAEDLAVGATPVVVTIGQAWSHWLVVNMQSGVVVAETARTRTTLTLVATAAGVCDIAVF